MTNPAGFEEAAALIPAHLRPGVMTNLASPEALRGEELELLETRTGLFIFRKRDGFRLLTFLMNAPELPEISGTVVSEAVFAPGADSRRLTDAFTSAGFVPALRRLRLTRAPNAAKAAPNVVQTPPERGPKGVQTPPEQGPKGVRIPPEWGQNGVREGVKRVSEILQNCFSPLTGCLPGEAELSSDISSGRVLTVREDGEIAGVLRFKITGRQAEIRHLAVDAPFRGRGLSERLIDGFLQITPGLRTSVWTGAENAPALAAYKSRGFAPDGRYSIVFLKGV